MRIRRFLTFAILSLIAFASASASLFGVVAPVQRSFVNESRAPVTAPISGAYSASQPTADSGWQSFVAGVGGNWSVQWNTDTQTPGLACGKPVSIAGFRRLSKGNVESACRSFIQANRSLFKIGPSSLKIAHSGKEGGRWRASFQQHYNGVPVFGSSVKMSFTKDDRLVMFGSTVFPGVFTDTSPALDGKQATDIAVNDAGKSVKFDRLGDPELCVLPIRLATGYDYLLCWRLQVAKPEAHCKLEYLIDAHTGTVLMKWDALWYDISGTASGDYKPEHASNATQVGLFAYETVTAEPPSVVVASWDMDTDPGWAFQEQWAYGTPTGQGGSMFGNPDPTSGHTGSKVYGVNLNGDYTTTPGGPKYLTTGPVDCSGSTGAQLKFWRWLNIDYQPFVYAPVEVSNDGIAWTTVWTNAGGAITDSAWQQCSYDISAVADGRPAVYVRWGYQVLPGTRESSGWNLDDVSVVSLLATPTSTYTSPSGAYSLTAPADPCAVKAKLKGQYCAVTPANGIASVFEQQGVGPNGTVNVVWNSTRYARIVEPNAYWHVNYARDYYSVLDPSFHGLDYALPVTVSLAGYNNAYWDGMGITLGQGDGVNYGDFGLYSDVIYHEYTHGVTDKIYYGVYFPYAMESGALNEGWSDYFGCRLTVSRNPYMGDGGLISGLPNGWRTLVNGYRRENGWVNEVHGDSQMFSGSMWEARQSLGTTMDELVHFSRYDHPMNFEEALAAIIVEDDTRYGDADPSNGSPHAQTIFTAFGNHGIGGLECLPGDIRVDDSSGNANGKIDPGETVSVAVTLTNSWANATDVSATLTCTDPYAQVQKGSAAFPSASYGSTVNNDSDMFVISVASSCPETRTIRFSLQISASGPYAYSRTCLLYQSVAVGQMAYDDDGSDYDVNWGLASGGTAVRFTPDSYPCYLMAVRLKMIGSGTVPVKIWDDDAPGGAPGTLLGTVNASIAQSGQWMDVDVSPLELEIDDGSFYAGWIKPQDNRTFSNAMDFDPPYAGRSWIFNGYYWYPIELSGWMGNNMVRIRWSSIPFPPGPVTNFVALPGNQQVSLSWTNPTHPYFAGTKILFKTTGYPSGPTDTTATAVYDGTGASYVHTGLTNGVTYYYSAFTHDAIPRYSRVANVSATPAEPPSGPVTSFKAYGGNSRVDLAWTNPVDPNLAGVKILYKAGSGYPMSPTDPSATVIYSALGTNYSHTGLNNGTKYYYAAYTYTALDSFSGVAQSSTYAAAEVTIPTMKGLANSVIRAVKGNVVTAVFTGSFYIQDPIYPYGLKVSTTETPLPSIGQKVDVVGSMTGLPGVERSLSCTGNWIRVTDLGPITIVPAALNNKAVGGANLNDKTPGVVGGVGAHNVGLLVRVCGKVTQSATGYFYVDDGCGLKDGTKTSTIDNVGVRIKVSAPTGVVAGKYVVVTGIVSPHSSSGLRPQVLPLMEGVTVVGP